MLCPLKPLWTCDISSLLPCLRQLQRSPDQEEAQDQLLKANELEDLREEAHAAHHRGDYSTTISVLDRVIEVQAVGAS